MRFVLQELGKLWKVSDYEKLGVLIEQSEGL